MKTDEPYVSIGLPVHNGVPFLTQAIESLLAQTFEDFEVIISDNASNDRTSDICQEYAEKDQRIRYYRNEQNLGAAYNYNRVFELARGKYFKWATHDDVCMADLIERCVEILDRDPSVVLCYSRSRYIDEHGNHLKFYSYKIESDSKKPNRRFRSLICVSYKSHSPNEIFGLIRTRTLKETQLIPPYAHGDRILLATLSLRGRFYEIPEYLFCKREHPGRTVKALPARFAKGRSRLAKFIGVGPLPPTEWFDPRKKGAIVFPDWRRFVEHYFSVRHARLDADEVIHCYLHLGCWFLKNSPFLVRDVLLAAEQLLRYRNA